MNSPTNEGSNFWKKAIFVFVFFTFTPLALVASVISLVSIAASQKFYAETNSSSSYQYPISKAQVFASLPSDFPSIETEITTADARPEIIREYLRKHNSPMEPYADFIVQTADKYNIDYRLITAIAQKESGLGRIMPKDCFNSWGWGIHSQGTLCFDNWEEGIETVSRGIKENYIDKGYVTVPDIMKKYAHPSSTTWAEGVLSYMEEMK